MNLLGKIELIGIKVRGELWKTSLSGW